MLIGSLGRRASSKKSEAIAAAKLDVLTIESLVAARSAARKNKDFSESDRIRNEIAEMGVELEDHRDGTTTWKVKP